MAEVEQNSGSAVMQATAHFEKDFFSVIADAKRASLEEVGGLCGEDWGMIVTAPQSIAFIDAVMYVGKHFPDCDRRRHKREMRKALKRAYAGELPKIPVKLTPEPITLRDTTETFAMKGDIVIDAAVKNAVWMQGIK